MAQKDKVKELVGRGLGSYHTKSLQQIDRIERKNKEQNHKINILTSELDNDYLTKTEESSVVSLEHSKEGMVYLDELQGNTLVNYCPDGAKELTLNGDIDVEGTSVTLTEGVDNGKVDVMCEGNTLVNLYEKFPIKQAGNGIEVTDDKVIITTYEGHRQLYLTKKEGKLKLFKPNTTYTIIANVEKNTLIKEFNIINTYASKNGCIANTSVSVNVGQVGLIKGTFNTVDEVTYQERDRLGFIVANGNNGELILTNGFVILEGDWTNKEIPKEYFEGMKSVGECEDNKFEILSQSKNLFDKNNSEFSKLYMSGTIVGSEDSFKQSNGLRSVTFKCKKNTDYTISKLNGYAFRVYGAKEKPTTGVVGKFLFVNNKELVATINSEDYSYLQIVYYSYNSENTGEITEQQVIDSLQIEYGKTQTNYVNYNMNKKEISLNEPLRSVGNTKDKIVKIGGKWYIEKNCKEIILNGTESWNDGSYGSLSGGNTELFQINHTFDKINNDTINIVSDSIMAVDAHTSWKTDIECISLNINGHIQLRIRTDRLLTDDANGIKQWLQSNNIKCVYKLATPIYEPLEIEPTLNTYNDITHISNNSIIPCNMKIQNSGYNAIIKPSTLYTVALDTNNSGTIGLNLGGAKVTTTNNVATITTPATLTDDSLRLYGKGIKASKVRLLEGDKTNWIPSHFEGMKSSFEDKLQEDGTFKMEILSNNKNLIDMFSYSKTFDNNQQVIEDRENNSISIICNNAHPYSKFKYRLYLKDGEKIYVSYQGSKDSSNTSAYFDFKKVSLTEWYITGTTNPNGMVVTANRGTGYYDFNFYISGGSSVASGTVTFKDIMISKVDNDFVLHKSNKIQFSSIEPLRKWDRFVFKDNKLMIERGSYSYTINENSQGFIGNLDVSNNTVMVRYDFLRNNLPKCKERLMGISNVLPNNISNIWSRDVPNASIEDIVNKNGYLDFRIPIANVPNKDYATAHKWLCDNNTTVVYPLAEPTYEEIPFELQKIILEGYENGTLFFDTNIPPTSTVTYAGETPIVKSVKLNKTEVLNNTNDINDNIVPYLMDMDYRVVCLQLEGGIENISMARLFGGTYEMLQRDILSNRYSKEEYKYRLDAYLSANKITHEEYTKLGDMLND